MREKVKQIIDYIYRIWNSKIGKTIGIDAETGLPIIDRTKKGVIPKLFVILIIFIILYWTRYQVVRGSERGFYMINRLTGEITWVKGQEREKVLEEGWKRRY